MVEVMTSPYSVWEVGEKRIVTQQEYNRNTILPSRASAGRVQRLVRLLTLREL